MRGDQKTSGGNLTIHLSAIAENYTSLCQRVGQSVNVAAVVKANAYGLGVERVAPTLLRAGCRNFFVASLDEAVMLREVVGHTPQIYVLNGLFSDTAMDYVDADILPVLNSDEQIAIWRALSSRIGKTPACAIQIDTGMSRLGLSASKLNAEDTTLSENLRQLNVRTVLSHLACADAPSHPMNAEQLGRFDRARSHMKSVDFSLAASSGIFLGSTYHFQMVRPGYALYGGNPTPGEENPMRAVVTLTARVLQTREIPAFDCVGYGATYVAQSNRRIAILAVGYADGFFRYGSGKAWAVLPTHPTLRFPVVGRISMDSLCVDITDLEDLELNQGTEMELIGPHLPLDTVAESLQTIGYEILTALGSRYHRTYLEETP